MGVWSGRVLPFPAIYIWSFLILRSMFFRRLLRRLAAVLAFGAWSIFWKAMAMIIRAQMLIYGKEATTQIENSVPYYSVSKWSSNTKMLLLHFHAP